MDVVLDRLRGSLAPEIRSVVLDVVERSKAERRQVREGAQQVAQAAVTRLLESVRRLDSASTLTAVLDTLTELVAAEAGRAAVFVAQDSSVRGWRFAGFGSEAGDARELVLDGEAAGFLQRVLERGQAVILPAGRVGTVECPPTSAGLPDDRRAFGVPVFIGGEALVLIYADDANSETQMGLVEWNEAVELLARHAGRRLEALTAEQAVQVASGAVPRSLKLTEVRWFRQSRPWAPASSRTRLRRVTCGGWSSRSSSRARRR